MLGRSGSVASPPYLPLQPHRLLVGDILYVGARNVLVDEPLDGYFTLGPDGAIDLDFYGTCPVAGLTVVEAMALIEQQLKQVVRCPVVHVELVKVAYAAGQYLPLAPYRVTVTDSLHVRSPNALSDSPIDDIYFCSPDGTMDLGPPYGSVAVAGMSLEGARAAIECRLSSVVREPEVSVSLGAKDATGMLLQCARPAWRLPLYDLDLASSRRKGSRFSADAPMESFTRASARSLRRGLKELRQALEEGQREPNTPVGPRSALPIECLPHQTRGQLADRGG